MVYVICVDEPVPVVGRRGDRPYFTKTMPMSEVTSASTWLAFIFTRRVNSAGMSDREMYPLTHLGAVVRSSGQKVSTYDRLLKVEELFTIPGGALDVNEILAMLPEKHRGLFTSLKGGSARVVSAETSEAIIDALIALRPDAIQIVTWLQALDLPGEFGRGMVDEFWYLERDATNVALHIADISSTPLRAWRRPQDETQPFLAGIVPLPPRPQFDVGASTPDEAPAAADEDPPTLLSLLPEPGEQAMIEHDSRTFAGWANIPGRNFHFHSFSDGERRVEIANVNNTGRVEARVGVDLIYYHVNTASFVLVQYKRLSGENILVDKRLRSQLDRMEDLTKFGTVPNSPDQWRIGPDFAFVKLAQDQAPDRAAFGMVPGQYLPLSYIRILLSDDSTLGERGGRRLGYGIVGRYLSNKQFIDLTAHGLVGTIGISLDQLKRVVDGLLDEGDSVVIASDHSDETTVERQRRLRSRDPNRKPRAGR
jgi:hypothetical protein